METNYLKKAAWAALAAVSLAACQPNFLNEEQTPAPNKSGRTGADWLTDSRVAYGSSMDVETYTYRIVEDYGRDASRAMTQVNAAPRLHRQRIESRVLEDGSAEMNTEQLRPRQLEKLPAALRNWQEMGPHRTMVVNNQATFYDQGSRAISQRPLKSVSFAAQIQEARQAKGMSKNAPLTIKPPTGYPKVEIATIQKAAYVRPEQERGLDPRVGGDQYTWQNVRDGYLNQNRQINGLPPIGYPTNTRITDFAIEVRNRNAGGGNTISISHSLGGTAVRQVDIWQPGYWAGDITLGSPFVGGGSLSPLKITMSETLPITVSVS